MNRNWCFSFLVCGERGLRKKERSKRKTKGRRMKGWKKKGDEGASGSGEDLDKKP